MNEAEMILAWGEISGHLWTIVQFWASISFGVIAVAHFASEKMNDFLVLLVIFLYTLFSIYCGGFYISDIQLLLALYQEAEFLLAERGEEAVFLTAFANYSPWWTGVLFGLIGLPSIYLGSIAYLIYRYRGRAESAQSKAS
jgi:hypothetical protein